MNRSLVDSFSRAAHRYRKHARVQDAMAAWLSEWLPEVRTGRALEVGAGPGILTSRLIPWPGGLTATDISAEMCKVGRASFPQLEWRTMPAEAPEGGPWDWLFCSSVLQWVAEPLVVFKAWRGALSPGGRVLAGLFTAGSLQELSLLLKESPLIWREQDEWLMNLANAGFRSLRSDAETRVFKHPSARALMRDLHGVGAAPRRGLSPVALRRLLAEYEQRFAEPGGGVRSTWRFFRFEAERTYR